MVGSECSAVIRAAVWELTEEKQDQTKGPRWGPRRQRRAECRQSWKGWKRGNGLNSPNNPYLKKLLFKVLMRLIPTCVRRILHYQ